MDYNFDFSLKNKVSLSQVVEDYLTQFFNHYGMEVPPSGLYDCIFEQIEKPLIKIALKNTNGNQRKAADLLGINRNTLRKKIIQFELNEFCQSHL